MELSNQDLLVKARDHQRAARAKEASPSFAFLLTPDTCGDTPFSQVVHLSGKKDKPKLLQKLQKDSKAGHGRGASEKEVMRVFAVQSPSRPTIRTVGKFNTSQHLPGGVPVVDHLMARIQDSPDWTGLVPVVEDLRNSRLPDCKGLKNFKELTLGVSTPEQWRDALAFMNENLDRDKISPFPFCAVDTESVQVSKTWSRDDDEEMEDALLRNLKKTMLARRKYRTLTVIPRKYSRPEETKGELVVRLTIGGRGWMVTIRLPTEEEWLGEDQFIHLRLDTKLTQEVEDFFRAIPCAVGVGITKDFVSWARLLHTLWGSTAFEQVSDPIELAHLARGARINDPSSSVFHLNWWMFGTLLPKDEGSMGDGTWGREMEEIPAAIQEYLCCDIEQVSKLATVLSLVWAIQTFPDLTLVKDATLLDEWKFANWVQVVAIPQLFAGWLGYRRDQAGRWKRANSDHDWKAQPTVKAMRTRLAPKTAAMFSTIWEVPDWPSVTCGGCRFLHQARAATVKMLDQLHSMDPYVWPDRHLANLEKRQSWMFGAPTNLADARHDEPVTSMGLHALPGYESVLNTDPSQWLLEGGLGYARERTGAGRRAVILMHMRINVDSARSVVLWAEDNPDLFRKLLDRSKVMKTIRDMRAMLRFLNILTVRDKGWTDPFAMEAFISHKDVKAERHLKRKLEDFEKHQDLYAGEIVDARYILQFGKKEACFRSSYAAALHRATRAPAAPPKKRKVVLVEPPAEVADHEDKDQDDHPMEEPVENKVVIPLGVGGKSNETGAVGPDGDQARPPSKRRRRKRSKKGVIRKVGDQKEEPEKPTADAVESLLAPSGHGQSGGPGRAAESFLIREDMEDTVRAALGQPMGTPVAPTPMFHLTVKDLWSLQGKNWLNDAVIDGYMHLISQRAGKDGLPTVHVMDSHFYTQLLAKKHTGVAHWTKNVDIFACDLLLIPLNLAKAHWALAVVDMLSGAITVHDSMLRLGLTASCGPVLLNYLMAEHRARKNERIPEKFQCVEVQDVPQQVGGDDCGVFVCRFAETITRRASTNFSAEDMPHFRRLVAWELITGTILQPREEILPDPAPELPEISDEDIEAVLAMTPSEQEEVLDVHPTQLDLSILHLE